MGRSRFLAAACLALVALLALAPSAGARRIYRHSASGITPELHPYKHLRKGDRRVKVSARSVAGAKIEASLQVFCFDKNLRVRRKLKTFTGMEKVSGKVRRPKGKGLSCSTSAAIRVVSRPSSPSGAAPPVRLHAALYATR